jgi:hypothetical protein
LAFPIAKLKMLGSPDPDCVTVIVGMAKQRTSNHFGNSSVDEDSFRIKKNYYNDSERPWESCSELSLNRQEKIIVIGNR